MPTYTFVDAGSLEGSAYDLGTLSLSSIGVSGSVGTQDPVDLFKFTLTSLSRINFSLSGLAQDADLSLLDSTGKVVAGSALAGSSSEWFNIDFLEAGTYYLRVAPFDANAAAGGLGYVRNKNKE